MTDISENNYIDLLKDQLIKKKTFEKLVINCSFCQSEINYSKNLAFNQCPFCANNLAKNTYTKKIFTPDYFLPFTIDKNQAESELKNWLKKQWFVPTKVKKQSNHLKAVYLSFWSFDLESSSEYSAQIKNINHLKKNKKDKNITLKSQVNNKFFDLIISSDSSLPKDYMDLLEPWNINNSTSYKEEMLNDCIVEVYKKAPDECFEIIKKNIRDDICISVSNELNGLSQKIDKININYQKISINYVLLPLWLNTYKYNDKTYRFIIKAHTGEVIAERPYSKIKIFFLGFIFLLVIGFIIYFFVS